MRTVALAGLSVVISGACLALLTLAANSQAPGETAPTQAGAPQEQILVPRSNEKPSFDCAKAKTAAARLICADAELARLDGELGAAFQKRKLQLSAPDQAKFVADELAWVRDRNERCGLVGTIDATIEELAASKPCMVSTIRERIAFLTQTGSSSSAGAPLQLLDTSLSRSDQATQARIIGAGCRKDGDVITIQGVATAQSLELANGSVKDVWLLVTDRPFCVIESPNGVDAPREISVSRLQIIGQPPPPGATIELTGKLSTGNVTQYYAVSTAISVISGRRIAAPSTPNAANDSPKFDANQVAALLDRREPAMTALEEIAPTMGSSDSKQLISALNGVIAPMTDPTVVSIVNCASVAASRGSRSAVNILQNECSREYLDWFPTCTQTTKACATMALFNARIGIEAYEQCLSKFDRTACNPTDPDSYFVRGPAAPKDSKTISTSDQTGGPAKPDQSIPRAIGWLSVGLIALIALWAVIKVGPLRILGAVFRAAVEAVRWAIAAVIIAVLGFFVLYNVQKPGNSHGDTESAAPSTPRFDPLLDSAANVNRFQEFGYRSIGFEDFKLDGKQLAATNAKLIIQGFYKKFGEVDTLQPSGLAVAMAREYGNDNGIPLLTDDATRNVRKLFLQCGDNPAVPLGCPVTVTGHASMCTMTNLVGSKNVPCLAVEDGW